MSKKKEKDVGEKAKLQLDYIEGQFRALRQVVASLKLVKDMCYSDMTIEEPFACIDVISAAMGEQIKNFNLILAELSSYFDGLTYEPVEDGPA